MKRRVAATRGRRGRGRAGAGDGGAAREGGTSAARQQQGSGEAQGNQHVNIGGLDRDHGNREALQLSTRQILHAAADHVGKIENFNDVVPRAVLVLLSQNLAHYALDRLGDVVDVLRLDNCLHRVLKNSSEEILQFAATEIC